MKMLWKIVFLSVSIVFLNFYLSWLSTDFHILNCFHLILRQNSLQAKVSYMSLWLWKLERKMLDEIKVLYEQTRELTHDFLDYV